MTRRRRAAPSSVAIRRGGTAGQSAVEFALVLPFAVLVLLAVIQVGAVVHDQVMVTHAAREAVRVAAVSPDAAAVRRAAATAGDLDPARVEVTISDRAQPGSLVRVYVACSCATELPIVGALVPDVPLSAEATMQVEQ